MSRVDIVEVIQPRLPLKKAGRDYVACCPFHAEKTPSFTVSPAKQFYHCFGCGAHGTAIGFLMAFDHLSFVEAVEELASQVGLPMPRLNEAAHPHRNLQACLEEACAFYQKMLAQSPRGKRYLAARGIGEAIIERYRIGYAPPGWDTLLRALGKDQERCRQLVEAGLVVEREGKRYDRFRDRIMFPIHDPRGKVVGFGGRVIDEGTPKYLNSPETPLFQKGTLLYGLHQARQAGPSLPHILVVEGYMDVIGLAQHGFPHSVATLGTSVTRSHIQRLLRTAPKVLFCFDADAAGKKAAWRALENVLPELAESHKVGFIFLPEGEDPDSWVREKGPEALTALLENPVPVSEFFFDALAQQVDMDTLEGRAQLVELARPLLSNMPQGVFREMMQKRLARLAGLESLALEKPPARPPSRAARQEHLSPVHTALVLLLHKPALARKVEDFSALGELRLEGMPELLKLLELLKQHPHLNTGAILEHWRDTPHEGFFLHWAQKPLLIPEKGIETQFADTLNHLKALHVEQRIESLLAKAERADLHDEERRELQDLLQTRIKRKQRDRTG
ncbi:MAG: DNA primase [Gammaproteobacteria bacterium]|nr:MAG: DNA primase [Gammaproteobacteria bacterium]